MNNLTEEQVSFLEKHNIRVTELFDAFGLKRSVYIQEMEFYDYSFAFNTTPCKKYGHTLRTKAGHCIQCNTAVIAFQNRSIKKGFVYLAKSNQASLVKIGFTEDIEKRKKSLNSKNESYGDITDWKLEYAFKSNKAGFVEYQIHSKLNDYSLKKQYYHEGKIQTAREIYKCDLSLIVDNLILIFKEGKIEYTIIEF